MNGRGADRTLPDRRPGGPGAYAIALAGTIAAILSQYVVPMAVPATAPIYRSLPTGILIIYGIPLAAFAALVGPGPLRRFASGTKGASIDGLRWYGLLSVLGLLVAVAVVAILNAIDPAAVHVLETKTNPQIAAARSNPWFWVGFSFVIGALEETIFRGYVFGYWLARGSAHWVAAAFGSSALFAGVHLYYATTFGVGALALYPTIFLLGFAFAAVYRSSGGNLVVVALLHGANDAWAFLSIVSPALGLSLHYGLVGIGALLGLAFYLRSRWAEGNLVAPGPIPHPGLPVAYSYRPPPSSEAPPGSSPGPGPVESGSHPPDSDP